MRDLFEQKIKVKNIRDIPFFNDFKGPDNDYDAGKIFRSQFFLFAFVFLVTNSSFSRLLLVFFSSFARLLLVFCKLNFIFYMIISWYFLLFFFNSSDEGKIKTLLLLSCFSFYFPVLYIFSSSTFLYIFFAFFFPIP